MQPSRHWLSLTPLFIGVLVASALSITVAFSPGVTYADRFDSANYTIQFGNFNITSGEKSSVNYNVTDTVGQTGAGPYGSMGTSSYVIGGGFQYIYPLRDFEFSLSSLAIDLETLLPGAPSTKNHTMTVTTRGAGGYKVYALADHSLRHSDGTTTIPATTCDAGTCTISTAQLWTNVNIPGFGFNMSGTDIPADFSTTSFFRPFADKSLAQTMQIVMSSANLAIDHVATVTYKAGVSGSQAAGSYTTTVNYIAVPAY
jgi:hypothetical protein